MRSKASYTRTDWIIALILLVVASVSRVYGFWQWPLTGDEIFTVRDALKGDFLSYTKPGMYVLVAWMFKGFGVSEWTARLPSLLFGILSVPVFYAMSSRIFGRYAAAWGSLFIILSGWHLYQSQFARFYTAVFLFGTISYFSYYEAYRTGKIKYVICSIVSNGLGIIFHTTFLIVPISCCLFSLLVLGFKPLRMEPHFKKIAIYYLIPHVLGVFVLTPFGLRVLQSMHVKGVTWGYGFFHVFAAIVKYLGIGVCIGAFFGLLQLLRKEFFTGVLVGVPAAFALLFLVVLSPFVNMRPDFIFCSAPLFFFLSGYICEQIRKQMPSEPFLYYSIALLIMAAMLPQFVSYYTAKKTLDIQDAVHFVEKSFQKGDSIVNFHNGFKYYWKKKDALEEYPGIPINSGIDWDTKLKPYESVNGRVWFVIEVHRAGISPGLKRWLLENTCLIWEKQSRRYDYTFESIQIYTRARG